MPQTQDPRPFPPDYGKIVVATAFASIVLGLFCLYDALREGLTACQYHTSIPLLDIYKGMLGISTAIRQGHLWSDPDAKPTPEGRCFVLAWAGVYVTLNAVEFLGLSDPRPAQPAQLNDTLKWVLGFYVFGKASALARVNGLRPLGLGRALDARRAAEGPPAPGTLAEEKRRMMSALRLTADVLGAVCLFDVLREGVTSNRSLIDIHSAYRLVLAALAGTNQWRKWTDPNADSPRGGYKWLLAWLGAVVFLKGAELISSANVLSMPTHLAGTLLWVFSIYGLGWACDLARKGGLHPWAPGPALPGTPAPPAGQTGGAPAADPPEPPLEAGSEAYDLAAAILEALEDRPEGLSSGQLADAVGRKRGELKRLLKRLVESGQIVMLSSGIPHDPGTRYRLAKYGPSA